MKDFKTNIQNKTSKKTTNPIETKDTFLKRIKELDTSEQELLLKLYNVVIKEMK